MNYFFASSDYFLPEVSSFAIASVVVKTKVMSLVTVCFTTSSPDVLVELIILRNREQVCYRVRVACLFIAVAPFMASKTLRTKTLLRCESTVDDHQTSVESTKNLADFIHTSGLYDIPVLSRRKKNFPLVGAGFKGSTRRKATVWLADGDLAWVVR